MSSIDFPRNDINDYRSSVLVEITDETNIAQVSNHVITYVSYNYFYLGIWVLVHCLVLREHCGHRLFHDESLNRCPCHKLGSLIGGSLSRPAEQFPKLFGNNEFLKEYPYFLPCAVPATFAALAWPVTLHFMKETVHNPRHIATPESERSSQVPLHSLLTSRVLIAAGNYGCLSFVDIAFRTTQPLFFSTPIEFGGLGLASSTIGKILSIYGILNGAFQFFLFAKIHDIWGSKIVFRAGIASVFPTVAAFPLMSYLAKTNGLGLTLWSVMAFQTVIFMGVNLSYGMCSLSIHDRRELGGNSRSDFSHHRSSITK